MKLIPTIVPLTIASTLFFAGCSQSPPADVEGSSKPNVLFIAIDDMNDWTTLFDPSNPIKTPNLERLAARGTFFTQAHVASPACNPSRTAILSGLRPSTSGVYSNSATWRDAVSPDQLLPAHFQSHGYETYSAGKLFHHQNNLESDYAIFDDYLRFPAWPPDAPMPETFINGHEIQYDRDGNSFETNSPNFDWGVWPPNAEDGVDARTVAWAENKLAEIADSDDPFFLSVGIFRPHAPTFAPQEFFDMYPLEDIPLPPRKADDLDDLPPEAHALLHKPRYRWFSTLMHYNNEDPNYYRSAVRGYMAASTYADHNVGRVLDALETSGRADDTLIVLWSDHGYFLGHKERWEKFSLYDIATHVPFIISVPDKRSGARCDEPVNLVDIFPTLADLVGLPIPERLDGDSLAPLIENPDRDWRPTLITYEYKNHSVRSKEYRYTKYADGDEELYHTQSDPNEWENIADQPGSRAIMDRLAQWLPETNAEPIGN